MVDQNTFMETVNSVAEMIRTSEQPMSKAEILSYFDDMELSGEQKNLVINYLEQKNQENPQETEDENQADESQENSKIVRMYMEDLSVLPAYNEEDKINAYRQLQNGEEQSIEVLSNIWLKQVIDIAKQYMDTRLKLEDLIQEGNIALFSGLQELKGTDQSAYDMEETLKTAIAEGIVRYISEQNSEDSKERTLIGKLSLVQEARNLLTQENGQEPTIQELAGYTHMSIAELEELNEFITARH